MSIGRIKPGCCITEEDISLVLRGCYYVQFSALLLGDDPSTLQGNELGLYYLHIPISLPATCIHYLPHYVPFSLIPMPSEPRTNNNNIQNMVCRRRSQKVAEGQF